MSSSVTCSVSTPEPDAWTWETYVTDGNWWRQQPFTS